MGAFAVAIDRIIELRPDLCIHSGDLFHKVRPLNSIMARAGLLLHRLAQENGIPTIIITGNHDAPRMPHVGAALDVYRQIDNLHVVSRGKIETIDLAGAKFHALPHCLTPQMQKEQLALLSVDPEARFNVLIAHGVIGGMPEFSMADLGEQELPQEITDPFDYTALGHFHNFCQVAHRAWYAGSTERLSQAERQSAKGFAVVDLDPFEVTFHKISTRPMVDIPVIDASGKRGDELATIINESLKGIDPSDKIVRVRVEGVSSETLKTLPANAVSDMKRESFALDIQFQREPEEGSEAGFGRAAIGRLDQGFIEYLDTLDLKGLDRNRLVREALKYLQLDE